MGFQKPSIMDNGPSSSTTAKPTDVILSVNNTETDNRPGLCEMEDPMQQQQQQQQRFAATATNTSNSNSNSNNTGAGDRRREVRVSSSTMSTQTTALSSSKSFVKEIGANNNVQRRIDTTENHATKEIMSSGGAKKVDLSFSSTQRLDRLSLRDDHPHPELASQEMMEEEEEEGNSTSIAAHGHLPQGPNQHPPPPPDAAEDEPPPQPVASRIPIYHHQQHHHHEQQQQHEQQQRPVSPCQSVGNSSHCSTTSSSIAFSNPRKRFLLFVKILFKCLDQANEPEVLKKSKKIIAECTRRNRLGDPQFTPLMESVEKRLRGFVGEVHWRRSVLLLRHYLLKQKNNTIHNDQGGGKQQNKPIAV